MFDLNFEDFYYEDVIDGGGANDIAHDTNNGANNTQVLTTNDGVGQNRCVRAGQGSRVHVEKTILQMLI